MSYRWNLHLRLLLPLRSSWKCLLFRHDLHCWGYHSLPLLLFVQSLPCPSMLPENVPLTAPMCDHHLWYSSKCNTHVSILVLQGFLQRLCLPSADSENGKFPTIANFCPVSIWLNRISIRSLMLYVTCILSWFFIKSTGVIYTYRTYSQSIKPTKNLLAYPIKIYFPPLIHWLPMAAATIVLRAMFMFLTRWYSCRLFCYFWSATAMLPCVGLRGYSGERPGFIGVTNAMCECRA